jgi:hypothetical protein
LLNRGGAARDGEGVLEGQVEFVKAELHGCGE